MRNFSRQCVILVGGLGTRLGALTADCPKPLLEVDGKPFLAHLISNVERFGFNQFVLLAGFKSDMVESFARQFAIERKIEILVRSEASPAGTAGALLGAADVLRDEFLMLNGDSFFDCNILDLATFPGGCDWVGRMALRRVADTSRYGRIDLSGDRIAAVREKADDPSEGLINGGIYWLKREILERVTGSPMSLERNVFPSLVEEGLLEGREFDGPFIDIGIPQDLAFAQANWREFVRRPATFFDRDGVLNWDQGYTHKRDDFRWIDGAKQAIKQANDDGRYVFVVTNQAGIARGFYDKDAVLALHQWMNEDLRRDGAHIDDFRFCPHHPEGTVPELSISCDCRKPRPGMLESLISEWPVDRDQSVLIGDKESDIEAAASAGVRGFQFDGSTFDWMAEVTTGPR